MKRFILGVVLLLILLHPAIAQPDVEWERLYGQPRDLNVFIDHMRIAGGGWAFAGWAFIEDTQFYLVVTDEQGQQVLIRDYGNETHEYGMVLCQTEDNGFLLGGYRGSTILVYRVTAEGNIVWERTYGEFGRSYCWDVHALKNDEFFIVGKARVDNNTQGYLIKIEGDGDVIWERFYGGEGSEALKKIILGDNGYVLVGASDPPGVIRSNIWLIKINPEGELLWERTFGTDQDDVGLSVRLTNDGSYIICGYIYGQVQGGVGTVGGIAVRTDDEGNQQWLMTLIDEELRTEFTDIRQLPAGSYAVAGAAYTPQVGGHSGYVAELNVGGGIEWQRIIPRNSYSWFYSMVLGDGGAVTLAGTADVNPEQAVDTQGWFVRLSPADLPPEIISKSPPDSLVRVPCGGVQAFSVRAVDPELQPLSYRWTLDGDTVCNEDLVILQFPELDTLDLRVYIRDNRWTISTGWQVMVVPLLYDWWPVDTILTRRVGWQGHFYASAGLPDDTTLTYRWMLNGETVSEVDSLWHTFLDTGISRVRAFVAARGVMESVGWTINVFAPTHCDMQVKTPNAFYVEQVYPNPFNNQLTLKYFLPASGYIDFQVLDVFGRTIICYSIANQTAGWHHLNINASDMVAGVYFIKSGYLGNIQIRKTLLIK